MICCASEQRVMLYGVWREIGCMSILTVALSLLSDIQITTEVHVTLHVFVSLQMSTASSEFPVIQGSGWVNV
jgi:hypothetical protein